MIHCEPDGVSAIEEVIKLRPDRKQSPAAGGKIVPNLGSALHPPVRQKGKPRSGEGTEECLGNI
jgi:hypothetical protein